MNSKKIVDKFHIHEFVDRIHIICSMIDDFLLEHPVAEKYNLRAKIEDVQSALSALNTVGLE